VNVTVELTESRDGFALLVRVVVDVALVIVSVTVGLVLGEKAASPL
jgi:phage-related holin